MGSYARGLLGPRARKPSSPSCSPFLGTTIPQPIPNLQMNIDRNRADEKTPHEMKSMDRNETKIPDLTQTGSPDRDTGIDLKDQIRRDGEGAKAARAMRGRAGTKKLIALLAGVLIGVAAALYYLRFIAPFESTDDAFIEGHVTQVAPQVAGRIARVLINDNQFVNAGEVLVEIEPSDYEATLQKEGANLASARSRLEQARGQLTVDQAKAAQDTGN